MLPLIWTSPEPMYKEEPEDLTLSKVTCVPWEELTAPFWLKLVMFILAKVTLPVAVKVPGPKLRLAPFTPLIVKVWP